MAFQSVAQKSTEADLRDQLAQAQANLNAAELRRVELAQAFHDTICQSLSGVQLMTRVVARKLVESCPESSKEVNHLGDLLQRTVDELHELTRDLRTLPISGAQLTTRPKSQKARESGSHPAG